MQNKFWMWCFSYKTQVFKVILFSYRAINLLWIHMSKSEVSSMCIQGLKFLYTRVHFQGSICCCCFWFKHYYILLFKEYHLHHIFFNTRVVFFCFDIHLCLRFTNLCWNTCSGWIPFWWWSSVELARIKLKLRIGYTG